MRIRGSLLSNRGWARSVALCSLTVLVVMVCTSCDWTQFRFGADHTGFNSIESAIGPANVASIRLAWTGTTGDKVFSSPAVANGVVYVGSQDGKLYAFSTGCGTGGAACSPLWTATTGSQISSSPAVANGVVYVGSADGNLYAYPAACGTGGATCSPLWTGHAGAAVTSSPVVSNGVVYATSYSSNLVAFPASCGTGGAICSPLWTASLGTGPFEVSSPAVSNGVLYVGSSQGTVFAFSTSCETNGTLQDAVRPDATTPVCSPLWTANTSSEPSVIDSSPAVSNGVVYIDANGSLWAFPAACGTTGGTCAALWTAPVRDSQSSPAVANGYIYTGDQAFAAAGCGSPTCSPVWSGTTGGIGVSSPAVANGLVYIGSEDGRLYAFGTTCGTGNATCSSLLTNQAVTGGDIESSPTIADGAIYVGSDDGKLYAYKIPASSS